MRIALLLTTYALFVILVVGCGGHNWVAVIEPAGGRGSISFTINWPENASVSRVIPMNTATIIIVATQNGKQVGTTTITRPAASGRLDNIPVGLTVLTALARDTRDAVVATGSTSITVQLAQVLPAKITLSSGGTFGTKINTVDGAEMVWVPSGSFTMGDDWSFSPMHQVTLTGYWTYKYEVTVSQYRAFCAATGYALPHYPGDKYSWAGKSGWDDPALQPHPIVNVTWYDAKAYADWAGVMLPTEAQWEYAARGPEGRNYPWGGTATALDQFNGWDPTKCANDTNSYSKNISTWPVGSFAAGISWCDAQDLAGNVWEWCADWYGDYTLIPVTNPAGPMTGDSRVIRGGSWYNNGSWANLPTKSMSRSKLIPDSQGNAFGFRCVSLSPEP